MGAPWVDPTRSSETGAARGPRWHNLPREGKGEEGRGGWARQRGREGTGGGVRGRWAPLPAEGGGSREGQRQVNGGIPMGAGSCRQQYNGAALLLHGGGQRIVCHMQDCLLLWLDLLVIHVHVCMSRHTCLGASTPHS